MLAAVARVLVRRQAYPGATWRSSTKLRLSCRPIMATAVPDNASLEQDLVVAQAAVTKQGDTVRSLKASLKEGKADKVSTRSLFNLLDTGNFC